MLPMNNFTAANTSRREIMDAAEQVEGMLPAGSGICFLNVLHALNAFETMAEADSFRKPEFALEVLAAL